VKDKRWSNQHLTLAISFVAFVAPLIIWWVVFHHSSATVAVYTKSSSDAAPLQGAHLPAAATGLHFIAMQSPGAVLRQGGGRVEMQTTVANCAKGFVRRSSMCEVGAPTQIPLSAGSNLAEQRSVRPPERE
jgi:hypothetical protein